MNAERLLEHFERIADAPDAIARLRRFILDLAVRGKLVPQDPNDEPAAELLKRITSEMARLMKAGEIRNEKPLPAAALRSQGEAATADGPHRALTNDLYPSRGAALGECVNRAQTVAA